jgi:hypothetical protein
MSHSTLSSEEISQIGKERYQQHLRNLVETPDNIGQIIAIDLNTNDYEIDPDLLVACDRLKVRHPDAVTWIERIGYDAVFAIGGTLVRTAP